MTNSPGDAAAWVTRLSRKDLPVLATVIRQLNQVSRDAGASAEHLAEVILRDAGLTAKVLRIANSSFFNPQSQQPVTTLTRAVVKLGFRGVRSIALSVLTLESLLARGDRPRLLETLATGFHAAVQAELIASHLAVEEREEAFVGGLLARLGEMALWGSDEPAARRLADLLPGEGDTAQEVEYLGTTITEISRALVRDWRLGEALQEALSNHAAIAPAATAIRLGDAVAVAAKQGWQSEAMKAVQGRISAACGLESDEVVALLNDGAERAAAVAVSFGAQKLVPLMPGPQEVAVSEGSRLQLEIMRELGTMIQEGADANTLFATVVEGVQRGVGLPRVGLCLLDPAAGMLRAKYCLGQGADIWRERLRLPAKSEQDNLLAYCLHRREQVTLQPEQRHAQGYLVNAAMKALINADNCLVTGLHAAGRTVGVLLADGGPKALAITREQQDGFALFAQQTNLGLAVLAGRRG